MAKDSQLEKLKFKEGDPVSAAALQSMADAIVRPSFSVRSSGGIDARRSLNGDISFALNLSDTLPFLGKTTSIITIRVGNVLGFGDVEEWVEDPSAGTPNTFVSSQITHVGVVNISSTTGGIPSGTWVACVYLASGRIAITSVDCGN